jgi:tetratricopeptide (TPR) repeat protein
MRILLKAMGFWIWGLIAISLSVSFVTLSYRLTSIYRGHAAPMLPPTRGTSDLKAAAQAPAAPAPTGVPPASAKISRSIAKEMTVAQLALQGGRWNEALDNLIAAQAKSPLTAVDTKTIDDFKAYAFIKINNLEAAQTAYEAELATGVPTVEETAKIFQRLFRLAASRQHYSKAIDYGQRLADSGAIGVDDLAIMSQIFYLNRDCRGSALWADKAIAAFHEAGEPPKENLYQFKLQCASDAGDTAGMAAAAAELIRLTNKAGYWNTLLRLERQAERNDHDLLMIYRLMYDTHSMSLGTDYIEMAQLLGDAGLSGEGLTVLEKAFSSGLVLDIQKERTTRLMESMRTRADADRRELLGYSGARGSLAMPRNENVGEFYFGLGDYQEAAAAIAGAVETHTVKHVDDAYVYLGRAQVALKDPQAARAAFMELKTAPGVSPRVIRIWSLYAETIAPPPLQPPDGSQ